MKRLSVGLVATALFVAGIALRLPGLGSYLTPDEHLWSGRTAQFMTALAAHDWAATTTSGHPGVTTTWAGAVGVALKSRWAPAPDAPTQAELVDALRVTPARLDVIPWLRLPIIVLCALGTVAVYLLARRLFGNVVALLASLFLLLDPFWLAHSKIIHLDGLLTITVTLAWLALLLATRTHQRAYYLFSGLAIGFGILTKSPALVVGPLILAWLALDRLHGPGVPWPTRFANLVLDGLWVGLPALLVAFLLWPALWVDPFEAVGRVLRLMRVYEETGHELGNFWLGQAVAAPGPLFYGVVLLWRTAPAVLPGLLIGLIASAERLWRGRRSDPQSDKSEWQAVWGLWALVLWFTLILSIGEKKFDRYLLPIFPTLDLLAAWGWVWLVRRLAHGRVRRAWPRLVTVALVVLIVLQGWGLLRHRPSYLTLYNPLLGGIRTARQVMLVGWGEGLEEAARYLNQQPDAAAKRAASWYGCNVFGPSYAGAACDVYFENQTPAQLYGDDMDYIVTYVNQIQRGLLDPAVAARLGSPLHTVTQGGVTLAQVYVWPKPFSHTGDRILADGWRLLGWDIGLHDATRGHLPVTLYWDRDALAAAPDPAQPVVVWLKDSAGEIWAKAEAPVAEGAAYERPGWLEQTAIRQQIDLTPPLGLPPGVYVVEVAPLAGQSTPLEQVQAAAVPASAVIQGAGAGQEVRFGDAFRLAGYEISEDGAETVLELLWVPLQTPEAPLKVFVHEVDADDQMIAQKDDCLGGAVGGVCSPMREWPPDSLIRQRVRMSLGASGDEPARLYVGLYHPDGGERLALTVAGQVVPDGRYLLPGLSQGAP